MTLPIYDKLYRMRRTSLTKKQLQSNLEALQALIEDRPIQYWSPILKQWCDCAEVCCEFEHRVKPVGEVSTDINDY